MQRILSLDLARGFTVLFIPIVHAAMIYGNASTYKSGFVRLLTFIAEWPGAQVFMMLMGISFVLSSRRSFRSTLVRSLVLLILGYSLNFLKFVLPYLFGALPDSFLSDMNANGWQSLLFVGDILQFAAISLLVLWFIQKSPDPSLIAMILCMFVAFATPFPLNAGNVHVLELVTGSPPRVFFPLFPWLVYPLAGFAIGEGIKEYGLKTFKVVFLLGCGLMLSSFCAQVPHYVRDDNSSFYVSGPWQTLMHLGFAASWISAWHFVTRVSLKNLRLLFAKALHTSKKKLNSDYEEPKWISNLLFRFLYFLSRRITLIYFIQWPLIFWLLPVFGYHKLDVWESFTISVDVALVTFLIAYLIKRPHSKIKNTSY